jgi:hypothetical protein
VYSLIDQAKSYSEHTYQSEASKWTANVQPSWRILKVPISL